MIPSHNITTARMTGGGRHESEKDFMVRCADVLDSHPDYPSFEQERGIGRAVLNGEMTIEEAYEALAHPT